MCKHSFLFLYWHIYFKCTSHGGLFSLAGQRPVNSKPSRVTKIEVQTFTEYVLHACILFCFSHIQNVLFALKTGKRYIIPTIFSRAPEAVIIQKKDRTLQRLILSYSSWNPFFSLFPSPAIRLVRIPEFLCAYFLVYFLYNSSLCSNSLYNTIWYYSTVCDWLIKYVMAWKTQSPVVPSFLVVAGPLKSIHSSMTKNCRTRQFVFVSSFTLKHLRQILAERKIPLTMEAIFS